MKEIAFNTFKWGGPGAVLFQLMLLAVVGWLLAYLAQAAGNGQIAKMIQAGTVFVAIALIAVTAAKAIAAVSGIAGF